MEKLEKPIRSSRIAANGAYGKRLSPRLNNNFKVHNASPLVDGWKCSAQRRFSPRLHKNCPGILAVSSPATSSRGNFRPTFHDFPQSKPVDSFLEPCVRGTFSPKPCESLKHNIPIASPDIISDSETQTPNICRGPNFQRRLSPRFHRDLASEKPKNESENSRIPIGRDPDINSSSVSQMQRRVSPRLHPIPENRGHEYKSQEPALQRRVSPRLHIDGENEKHKPIESVPQHRVSPRFHNGENEKKKLILDGRASKKRSHCGFHRKNSFSNAKRSKQDYPKDDGCGRNFKPSHSNGTAPTASDEQLSEPSMGTRVLVKKAKTDDRAPVVAGRRIHAGVKETLRIFNAYYLQFVKEKEVMQTSSRPDLKAVSKMKQNKEILYPDKRIGHIPGIEFGHQFSSRAEMVAIGFHSHWLSGIDYIGQSAGKMDEHQHYTFPIAVAIVMSGQYEDDLDNSEDIIYTGQGGCHLVGDKLQCADQVLLRGNLALKNSMEQSVPIRVTRGHKSANSYSGKTYTYDGLYKVVKTWADKGQRGHLVYKYHLKRIEGQPKLTTSQVQFVRGIQSKTLAELPGMVCRDISNGQEAICIPVTNLFDDALIDEGFTYMKTIEVAESVNMPPTAAGCACKGNCTNPKTCACAKLNGSDFPYVRQNGGRLVEAKDVVFECGPSCNCGPGCLNRTSQRGVKYHLEVFRTPDKGWAVRSWDFIPSGAPICEYIGLLRRSDEVDNISGNEFIFEIDCWHTMNEIEGRERRFGNVPVSATNVLAKIDEKTLDSTPEFCLDAGIRGNVARFINHSCEPNLFVQCILSTHHDLRLARLVLFAAENIPPLQELTYDYGYALDSVTGPDGKVKVLPCFCGAAECRKRLY